MSSGRAPETSQARGGTAQTPVVRRRVMLGGTALLVIGAGLLVSSAFTGFAADAVADALYTVLIYLLFALIVPRLRPGLLAIAAFVISAAIELAQLTGFPSALAAIFPPARFVFGTTFVATDLLFYAGGAVAVALVDGAIQRRSRSLHPGGTSRRP